MDIWISYSPHHMKFEPFRWRGTFLCGKEICPEDGCLCSYRISIIAVLTYDIRQTLTDLALRILTETNGECDRDQNQIVRSLSPSSRLYNNRLLRAAVSLNQNFFLTGYSIKSLTVILVCEYIKDVDFVRPAYSNEFLNPKILPKSVNR